MKLGCEDLPRHLAQGLAPLYVVHGEALLLALEATDAIRAAARAAGCEEREVLTVEPGFRWGELAASVGSMSLFSSRKLIDLRIPTGKPGVEGAQVLEAYSRERNPDVVTLISLPKLDSAAMKSKWFAALEANAVVVSAPDVPLAALPDWIARRLQRSGQTADRETLAFLAERVEGNLFAAWQEVQKLALLYPAGRLSFEQVKDAVMDVARYDVFKLSEAMLNGNVARYARILDGLRAEGTHPVMVLGMLAENIRTLIKLLRGLQSGGRIADLLREARVWGDRQGPVQNALRRVSLPQAERALVRSAEIDRINKGQAPGDEWDALLQLGLGLAAKGRA